MTAIDNRSARSGEKTEEDKRIGEVRRLADELAMTVQNRSTEPTVQIIAPLLAAVAMAQNYGVSYAQLRSQFDELWRSCGGKVEGDLVQVVSRGQFDDLIKGGR